MSFKAKESLSEQIAQHLAQQIIHGDMLAGDRIQELRVAGELDVSRGSVREALLILQRRQLIDILPRRGAVVKEMSEAHVRSLYEVMQVLLGLVIFSERLRPMQWLAVAIASVGVAIMTVAFGHFPWIALVLFFSFAF